MKASELIERIQNEMKILGADPEMMIATRDNKMVGVKGMFTHFVNHEDHLVLVKEK